MSTQAFALGTDTNRRRSPGLWDGAPSYEDIMSGLVDGIFVRDDFDTFFATDNKYDLLQADSGASVALRGQNTGRGGILRLTTGATDENEAYIGYGAGVGGITDFNAQVCNMWFEARCRVESIANSGIAWAIGLGEPNMAAANMLTDSTGALADKDYVGFRVLSADGNGLDAVHNTASGGGETVHQEEATGIAAQTLVADTWVKVGLRYDAGDDKMYWYVNGQKVNTSGVAESATNFPDGEELTFFAGLKSTSATGYYMEIDWWQIAVQFL